MTDERKLENEELTDEQTNEAVGGVGFHVYYEFTCGGCGSHLVDVKPAYDSGKLLCPDCIEKVQKQKALKKL